MVGERVGYVRVSSIDQNEGRQLEGQILDRTFTDKASGKSMNRPQLHAALTYLRRNDVLVVHSLDRLARNLLDLRAIIDDLTKRGCHVQFIKENLTFTGEDSPMANLLLNLLGSVAEFERSLIRERQAEGVALAKKKGLYKRGRKLTLSEEQMQAIRDRIIAGEPKSALARELGISRETFYTYLRPAA